ncbi:hypothetical protein BC628DRAFT_1496013 [Trametes gibbosa]|nr:hypothetical protein BC628DRAFT_1496013 [Trametes gibbosa]
MYGKVLFSLGLSPQPFLFLFLFRVRVRGWGGRSLLPLPDLSPLDPRPSTLGSVASSKTTGPHRQRTITRPGARERLTRARGRTDGGGGAGERMESRGRALIIPGSGVGGGSPALWLCRSPGLQRFTGHTGHTAPAHTRQQQSTRAPAHASLTRA